MAAPHCWHRRRRGHPDHVDDRRVADVPKADHRLGRRGGGEAESNRAGTPMPIEALLAKGQEVEKKAPTTVTVNSDPASAVLMSWGREKTLFINPYTGAVVSEGSKTVRAFFPVDDRLASLVGYERGEAAHRQSDHWRVQSWLSVSCRQRTLLVVAAHEESVAGGDRIRFFTSRQST